MAETNSNLADLLAAAVAMSRDIGTLREAPDGSEFCLVPPNWRVSQFKPELPNHVESSFEAADSFCEYVKQFNGLEGQTLLMASPSQLAVKAVLNYHKVFPSADDQKESGVGVRHATYVANYAPVMAEQYVRWRDIDEKWIAQDAAYVYWLQGSTFNSTTSTWNNDGGIYRISK